MPIAKKPSNPWAQVHFTTSLKYVQTSGSIPADNESDLDSDAYVNAYTKLHSVRLTVASSSELTAAFGLSKKVLVSRRRIVSDDMRGSVGVIYPTEILRMSPSSWRKYEVKTVSDRGPGDACGGGSLGQVRHLI